MDFRSLASLVFVGLVLPSCSDCCSGDACSSAIGSDAPPALDSERTENRSTGSAEPVSEFREERELEAVRGLEFEGERVRVDAEEAHRLVAAPDRAAADVAYAEGLAHLESNEILDAIRSHAHAVLLAPEVTQMYVGLGDALVREEGWESRAAAVYRTALDLEPESAPIWARYADASWRIGNVESAVSAWKRTIEIDPAGTEAYVRLANVAFLNREDALAWEYVHAAEARSGTVPPQMREMLAARTPEPLK